MSENCEKSQFPKAQDDILKLLVCLMNSPKITDIHYCIRQRKVIPIFENQIKENVWDLGLKNYF